MNVCQHVSVLFLLLLATEQAENGPPEGGGGEAFNFNEMRQELEKIKQEEDEQRRVQEGTLGERFIETSTYMQVEVCDFLSFEINSDSTLEEVEQKLKTIREKFYKDNPSAELVDVNNHALAALNIAGYFDHDLISLANKAIEKECYEFLKSLYPVTNFIWWNDGDLVRLLMKAFSCSEWMNKEEWGKWMSREEWKVHRETADLGLHFQDLIRTKNTVVYEDEWLRNSIFKDEIFKVYFRDIIQEAYDSGNIAFLSAVPYPSEEFPLKVGSAVFFWSLAYGQEWCSGEWNEYIDTIEDQGIINSALRQSYVFEHNNPKVFEHQQVKALLKVHKIGETLRTAIEYDSLSFAQYLKKKHEEEDFKNMVDNCTKVRTLGKTFSLYDQTTVNRYEEERLSRVYNFLLENGKGLDANDIEFSDVPILDIKHLKPLVYSGFNKVPLATKDFDLYGSTTTGAEFLKMILRDEYTVNGNAWKRWEEWKKWIRRRGGTWGEWGWLGTWEGAWSSTLSGVKWDMLDMETFKLISVNLGELAASQNPDFNAVAKVGVCESRKEFYQECMRAAIRKGDIKFWTDVIVPTLNAINEDSLTLDLIFLDDHGFTSYLLFTEAAKGNLVILDWILDFKPTMLEKVACHIPHLYSYNSPLHFPLLKHLFKKSKVKEFPPYQYLAKYAESHLKDAVITGNSIHYDEVRKIEGVVEAMIGHELEIPEFPERG